MKTSEVLRQSAGIVQMFGLAKHTLEDSSGRVCILGAILKVSNGYDSDNERWIYKSHAVLCELLQVANIPNWNNAPERTQQEVVDLFNRAADIVEIEEWTNEAKTDQDLLQNQLAACE